jgi:hypothetical protein
MKRMLLIAAALLAGCAGPGATPIIVYVTPRPVEADPGAPASSGPTPGIQSTIRPAPTAPPTSSPHLSREQENAIGTAEDYLDYSHFSRKGLIDQLEYEGFSTKVATFAVDSLHVDWNAQAWGTAEDYLKYSHFSRKGLIDQLEYEGFTHAQAVYGVNKAGL